MRQEWRRAPCSFAARQQTFAGRESIEACGRPASSLRYSVRRAGLRRGDRVSINRIPPLPDTRLHAHLQARALEVQVPPPQAQSASAAGLTALLSCRTIETPVARARRTEFSCENKSSNFAGGTSLFQAKEEVT